jgi:REP element-mobilizing transposase RayT
MPRPLRQHAPGTFHFITSRCYQARFLLRPDARINAAILMWLARAQRHCPGILVYAIVVMSNHVHVLAQDTDGSLAKWTQYFFGNLAKSVNAIRGRTGAVWSRRHSSEPVLDPAALLERLVYIVANPAQSGLCRTHDEWPGILLFVPTAAPRHIDVSWFDAEHFKALCRVAAAESSPRPTAEDARITGTFTVHPLPVSDAADGPTRVMDSVVQREYEIAEDRRHAGSGFMTREAVLSQRWDAAPAAPKVSPRPLCHTTEPALRAQFRETYRAFVAAFRDAAAEWARGILTVEFPDWCYRPRGGLVRAPPLALG